MMTEGCLKPIVCCFLWFDPHGVRNNVYVYDERHVLALKEMVERHLSIEHEFVCVSDRTIKGVKTIPLDYTTHVPGTRFAKLMMYRPDGYFAGRRFLYLDLDAIITGSLNPLIERDEDIVLWRNPNYGQPRRAFYNTSMILHTGGTHPYLWTDFNPDVTPRHLAKMWGGTDQAWISHRASKREAHWTAEDGVYGAGRLITEQGLDGVGTALPENARVVFTPGEREPSMPHMVETHPWIKEHYPLWQNSSDTQHARTKYRDATANNYEAERTKSKKWASEQALLDEIISNLPPGSSALDIPVGTGRLYEFFDKYNVAAIGMDVNADMSDQARQKGMTDVRHGDVTDIPLAADSVDASFCIRLMNWLSEADVKRALEELQRVTRKQITITLRVSEHLRARNHVTGRLNRWPVSLVEDNLKPGWKIAKNEWIDDGKPEQTFRMITLVHDAVD